MAPLLGLAGPAGAGFAGAMGLMCIGVCLTIVAAFLGLLLRSKIVTALSALGGLLTTLVFRPWQAFWPEPTDNWEVKELQDEFRFLAWLWVAALVGMMTACIDAYQRRVSCNGPV